MRASRYERGRSARQRRAPPSDANPIADSSYSYNQDGQKTEEDLQNGSGPVKITTYSYDSLGRLTQSFLPTGTCRKYAYDLDSNRSQIQESASGCGGTFSTVATYTYNPSLTAGVDELTSVSQGSSTTSYGYTADGQVTARGSDSLSWDGWGRLSGGSFAGTSVSYGYDATGTLRNRITVSPAKTTRYLAGDSFETGATGTVFAAYVPGPAGDLASFNGPPTTGSTVSYLYYSGHGDLAAETDNNGTVTGTHSYDPFGAPLDPPPANSTSHRYVGRWRKQYDSADSLILMGARPYDPNLSRFLTVDPIDGGSLNNYDYAGQDPINAYDLTGAMLAGGNTESFAGGTCDPFFPCVIPDSNCTWLGCDQAQSQVSALVSDFKAGISDAYVGAKRLNNWAVNENLKLNREFRKTIKNLAKNPRVRGCVLSATGAVVFAALHEDVKDPRELAAIGLILCMAGGYAGHVIA